MSLNYDYEMIFKRNVLLSRLHTDIQYYTIKYWLENRLARSFCGILIV